MVTKNVTDFIFSEILNRANDVIALNKLKFSDH